MLDGFLKHIHQVHGICLPLLRPEIEGAREDLVSEASAHAIHALINARRLTVLLDWLGAWHGVLHVLAVVHLHFGKDGAILRFLETGEHHPLCQHAERAGGDRSITQ